MNTDGETQVIRSECVSMEEQDELWIMKAIVLSTSHVAQVEMELLCRGGMEQSFGHVMNYPGGAILYLGEEIDMDTSLLSPGLVASIKFAHNNGFQWLRFDCDGASIEGIPSYDW